MEAYMHEGKKEQVYGKYKFTFDNNNKKVL